MSSFEDDSLASDFPLFRLAFRPFFLFGASFSLLAMAVWIATLNGWWDSPLYGGGFFWHVHEMVFGFVASIVVGFLLTAVRNWTGRDSISGLPLVVLVSLWLLARIGFLVVHRADIWLASLDISFLLVAAGFLAIPIVSVRQWRNLFFVPLLVLLAVANGMMHLGVLNMDHMLMVNGAHGALGLICILMVTIGGRIIPPFTASGTGTARVAALPWLERVAVGSVWLLMLVFLTGLDGRLPGPAMAALLMIVATANFVRWLRWRFWVTFGVVLLWTLHLAYLFIVAGFFLLALSWIDPDVPSSIAWHSITVGGMGGLILSMISRVSLGHTGRAIVAPSWMIPAHACVFAAAVSRTALVAWLPTRYGVWLDLSGTLWILAFGSFVACYSTLLMKPRVDNQPG